MLSAMPQARRRGPCEAGQCGWWGAHTGAQARTHGHRHGRGQQRRRGGGRRHRQRALSTRPKPLVRVTSSIFTALRSRSRVFTPRSDEPLATPMTAPATAARWATVAPTSHGYCSCSRTPLRATRTSRSSERYLVCRGAGSSVRRSFAALTAASAARAATFAFGGSNNP